MSDKTSFCLLFVPVNYKLKRLYDFVATCLRFVPITNGGAVEGCAIVYTYYYYFVGGFKMFTQRLVKVQINTR